MEPQLLKQPLLNYGQELLTALKEEQGIERVGFALQGISRADLQASKQRDSKDPLLQDPAKRSKFIRFLAHKADMLYKTWDSVPVCSTTDGENEELCAVMPPLESFMSVPASERKKHFFECLKKGDTVIGQVSGKQENGLFVTLVCMDGGLRREIHDLAIKAFCPLNQVPTFSAHESPFDVFQTKDLVRAVVISCSSESERIILSMKPDALPADQQHLMKLGLLTEEEIPSHHKRLISTHGRSYQEVLERTIGFNNPTTASHLCSALGIPSWRQASLTKALHMKEYPKEEYATALRKAQSSKWAYKRCDVNSFLKDGVMHFKAGNHSEAFACLNKALQIDPENVEALVARGALFANNSNLRRALEDFEQALTLNPNHPNARKYMSETLVALGRYYEERGDLEGAVKTYKKAVKVNLSNTDAREALIAMEVKERKKEAEPLVPPDTRSLSSQASLLAELQGEISKPTKDTREKLRLLLKDEVEKKHKKRRRHRSSSSSSWSSSSSSGASSRSSSSSGYKRHSRRHHRSRRSRKDRKESKAERHRGSKKKRKSRDGHRANTSPPPEEVAPAATGSTAPGGTASESYWKDEPAVVLSSPPAEATKAAAQRSSLSPLSKKLAHLYEDEDEVEMMKGSHVDDHNELSPKVTFLMKSNQEIQAPRLFNVDAKSAAASTAYYERKDRSSESARAPSAEPAQSAPRIESVVKRTEPQPAPERKGIEFKWKAVKKPLTHAGDSHEEGSVSSLEHREDAPQQQPSRGADDKAATSSHEEGSIHSDSEPAKRKKDRSSSRESSPKDDDDEGKGKRKLRRRSRADSESYSSSGRSKSPVRRRRSSRRSADHSDDYSTDRSSVASRGRRRRSSRGGRSSDSSRDDSRRRRYSSEDSRDGRRRSRSYSSDTDGSHRRHSPMRRGGYRPYYYNNNRGGYYKGNFNNRRYNNYRGGYQNNRYFRGGRGGRRPFRPYYNNRTSPRSYYNSGGGSYQRSSYSRDRRSDSETPQDRSFCPPWKRRNPIVSRAPDAEELKKLREAAAQRAQEKQELAAAEGGASTSTQRINKATIIRNWLDDGDSRSPPRASSPPSRRKDDAPPLPPPLPTDAPPLPEGD